MTRLTVSKKKKPCKHKELKQKAIYECKECGEKRDTEIELRICKHKFVTLSQEGQEFSPYFQCKKCDNVYRASRPNGNFKMIKIIEEEVKEE